MVTEGPTWQIKQHTEAKHRMLRHYLNAWFPIIASQAFNKILYLDGFAGPGVYLDGEPGSPLIALEALTTHPHFNRFTKTEFVFVFIEADPPSYTSLQKEITKFWTTQKDGKPDNITIELHNNEFAEIASQVVKVTHRPQNQIVPTFAFIDPFGWKGAPMAVIRDLLASDKCEILFSFMFDSVNRFSSSDIPITTSQLTELFGTERFNEVEGLSTEERKNYLRDLYKRQLKEVGGFKYVRPFDLFDTDRGRTVNFLMFGTKHHKGLKVMKEAMWSLDPIGGYLFHGFAGDQQMLFSPEPDITPLRAAMLDRFSGTTVSVRTIERFVIEETDYLTTHYKKQVLSALEKEGSVRCVSPRKQRYSYPPGTMLQFTPDGSAKLF